MAGRGRVPAVAIKLSASKRSELVGLARRRKTAQGLARRAQVVLAADGVDNKVNAARIGSDPNTVDKWLRRFAERGLAGLYDEPRPGAPRRIRDDGIAACRISALTKATPDGSTSAVIPPAAIWPR